MANSYFKVWTELVCLNCNSTTSGQFTTGTIRRMEMKEDAVKKGWIFDSTGVYCCINCKTSFRKVFGNDKQ